MDINDIFSKELLNAGRDVSQQKVKEIGWKSDCAIEAINVLKEKGFAILGGDIYLLKNDTFVSTYDNWFLDKNNSMSWEQFVFLSHEKAISYLKFYKKMNGDEFYYAPVFINENDYNNIINESTL